MYNSLLQRKVRTKLIYCDTKSLDPQSSVASHTYNLFNIADPDTTGVGHQPAFHDKWAALYGHYRVYAARWYITFTPHRIAEGYDFVDGDAVTRKRPDPSHFDQIRLPGIVGWETNDTNNLKSLQAADKNVCREMNKHNRQYDIRMTKPYPSVYKMKGFASASKLLDDPSDALQSAIFGSGPPFSHYLIVAALSKDGNIMARHRFDIRIEFFVEMSDPLDENEN